MSEASDEIERLEENLDKYLFKMSRKDLEEVNDEKLEEILDKYLLEMSRKEFEELTPICRNRIVISNGDTICAYYCLSPTECCFSNCPNLGIPFDTAAMRTEKTEEGER